MRYKKLKILVLVILVILLALPAFAIQYKLTDLGRGEAFGINDLGQITGWRPDPSGGPDKAFVWSKNSGFTDIGQTGTGRSINNLGQVTGPGWLWSQEAGLTPLSLPIGTDNVESSSINESGQIIGYVHSSSGYNAMLWNSPTDFVNLYIRGWTNDINNNGRIAGEYIPSSGEDHAFTWDPTSLFVDIGDFNSIFACANGINDNGQVVGQYHPGDDIRAFLWSNNDGLIDLGTLGGYHSNACKINNDGFVVGSSMFSPVSPEIHAFVWHKNTGMIDLGLLGGGNSGATDINSKNQIIGVIRDENNLEHIALWEPVPEPSSLFALGAGISILATLKRRKRG